MHWSFPKASAVVPDHYAWEPGKETRYASYRTGQMILIPNTWHLNGKVRIILKQPGA